MRSSVLLAFYPCRQHQSIFNISLLFYNFYYWKNTEVRTSGTSMVGTALIQIILCNLCHHMKRTKRVGESELLIEQMVSITTRLSQ